MESLYLVGVAVLALFAFVMTVILFNFFGVSLRVRIANAPVSRGKMVGMRLPKVPGGLIVDNRITAVKAGLDEHISESYVRSEVVATRLHDAQQGREGSLKARLGSA